MPIRGTGSSSCDITTASAASDEGAGSRHDLAMQTIHESLRRRHVRDMCGQLLVHDSARPGIATRSRGRHLVVVTKGFHHRPRRTTPAAATTSDLLLDFVPPGWRIAYGVSFAAVAVHTAYARRTSTPSHAVSGAATRRPHPSITEQQLICET